jgi:hypothetical protein
LRARLVRHGIYRALDAAAELDDEESGGVRRLDQRRGNGLDLHPARAEATPLGFALTPSPSGSQHAGRGAPGAAPARRGRRREGTSPPPVAPVGWGRTAGKRGRNGERPGRPSRRSDQPSHVPFGLMASFEPSRWVQRSEQVLKETVAALRAAYPRD